MYLTNSWYCAGWSKNLADKPLDIKIMGKRIVIYRGTENKPIAIGGVCPHRFAPLALGKVQGDNIMCPYHGLVYNKEGQCVLNPHGNQSIPSNAKVDRYPIEEKNGVLWIWMGSKEADTSQLTNADWLVSDQFDSVMGYLHINANYQMVMDNLLDLTHAPFLHADTVGGDPELTIGAQMEYDFRISNETTVHSDYLVKNMGGPTPYIAPLWGNKPNDFRANMTWQPPSRLELDIRHSPPGAPETDGIYLPSFHFLAPETETSCHYFYAMARNVEIDNPAETERMADFARRAFEEEDEPMIVACQENMTSIDLFENDPSIIQTDVAGVRARRILAALIQAEAAEDNIITKTD